MESSSYKITGKTVQRLPEAVSDALGATALVKHGDVTVLCHEKFYLRIESNLMSTIVFSMTEENVCFVDIVTGGGKAGLLGITFGAETTHTKKISDVLESVCESMILKVTPA